MKMEKEEEEAVVEAAYYSAKVSSKGLHNRRNHNVEIKEITLTLFWQKFRESNGFDKEVTKELI